MVGWLGATLRGGRRVLTPADGVIQHFLSSATLSRRSDHDYCLKLVKKHDFENYLCGLIWPQQLQPGYFAIRAFNVEIATIKDQIKENNNVMAGRMRFQWWRDALEHIGGASQIEDGTSVDAAQEHPVLNQLKRLRILGTDGPVHSRWLSRSLEARCNDLQVNQYDSLEEVEQYAEQSSSSLLYALADTLRAGDVAETTDFDEHRHFYRSEQMEFCLSHVGVASGLTLLLRGLPVHLAAGSCVLPRETMNAHGLSMDALFELAALPQDQLLTAGQEQQRSCLMAAVHDLASQANAHQERALQLQDLVLADPTAAVSATGPGVTPADAGLRLQRTLYLSALPALRSGLYLAALQDAQFDALAPALRDIEARPFPLDLQMRILKSLWQRKV